MAQQRNVEEGVELPITYEHLRQVFNKYDKNNDGKLNIHELKAVIESREYERDIPEEAVHQILRISDIDGNGTLDYDEFVQMVHNPQLHSIFGHYVSRYVNYLIPRRSGQYGNVHAAKKRVETFEIRERSVDVNDRGDSRPRYGTDTIDGLYEDEYKLWPPPVWMILISIVEIVLFCIDEAYGDTNIANGPVAEGAIYDPKKRHEFWRFITYMFVHIGVLHIVVNLLVQILLGIPLEMVHRGWRVLIIYFCGVLAGSLGTSITDPHVKLAGASGGVYALITAHIASVIMNWKEMQFALAQLLVFLLITGIDCGTAIYNRYHDINEHIGYAAHLAGAVAGLLVGIFVLRNLEENSVEKKLWWISLITFIALMATAIIWNFAYPSYFM